jgi:hypothetical protein
MCVVRPFTSIASCRASSRTYDHKIVANGAAVELGRIPPAHTGTDLDIRHTKANVLHLGTVFFSGMYPLYCSASLEAVRPQSRRLTPTLCSSPLDRDKKS